MGSRRALVMWGLAAAGATLLLVGVLFWDYSTRARWGVFLVGDPRVGEKLFFDRKGCAHCHALNGYGGQLAPDLGFQLSPQKSLDELVVAMWNHAPVMWERLQAEGLTYPSFQYREMAHLFAFLYIVRYVDEPGNSAQGKELFRSKGCVQCHAVYGVGGSLGPDLSQVAGMDTPLLWIQAMWNHIPKMRSWTEKLDLDWPRFKDREMNDLAAYIRQIAPAPRAERHLFPADPGRGWKLFQSKSCIVCHAVRDVGGSLGPPLDRGEPTHLTLGELAGSMWNHSPQMLELMQARNIPPPTFQEQELADLVAFLQGLGYFEPKGLSEEGEKTFSISGCSQCHGSRAEGTRRGPGLRKSGRAFTGVTLATALWSHGRKMYQRVKEQGLPWPVLTEDDLGPLLSFLNTPPQASQKTVRQEKSPAEEIAAQSFPFNHRIHLENSLGCADCHPGALEQARAGIPRLEFCMMCHADDITRNPAARPYIESVRWHAQQGAEIAWVRLVTMPEHVYFSHQRHTKIAGLDCSICHGSIGESATLVSQPSGGTLDMDGCMDCHEERGVNNDCSWCHR